MPKTNIGNRVLSLLLVLVMLIGCLPSVFGVTDVNNNRSKGSDNCIKSDNFII